MAASSVSMRACAGAAARHHCSPRTATMRGRPAAPRCTVAFAAKKGKKRGGTVAIPKSGASARPPYENAAAIMATLLLVESFKRVVGRIIHPSVEDVEITDAAKALYTAPFALVSLDEVGRVAYANEPAQRALGKDWGGLAGAPVAGLSAEALGLPEGSHVEGKDVPCGATKLLGATAWDVQSPAGGSVGLGVVFEAWEVDGVTVRAVAEEEPANEKVSAADPGELEEARAAVERLASAVRELKEGQGMSNSSPEVREAVQELLAAKERLAALEGQ